MTSSDQIRRWKVVCAYDGTDFCGWQVQPNGRSVQGLIEKRLETVLKEPVRIHGSGRTDAGVHAQGQVFHFDAQWNHQSKNLLNAMRGTMPESVLLKRIEEVDSDFHARFSATGKRYQYQIYKGIAPPDISRNCWSIPWGRRIDLLALKGALDRLKGWHDFQSFAVNRGEAYENTWRCVSRADVSVKGSRLILTFEGNGFMYKMVRGLVGAVLNASTGVLDLETLDALLRGKVRESLIPTAPSKGLCLQRVFYNPREYPTPPPHAFDTAKKPENSI